ncbi:MAG: MopE-related protein [Myxococcota bacterium]|nr:MopE-related protein [Myxococcota bacterium]
MRTVSSLLFLVACGTDYQITAEVQELIVSPQLSDVGLIPVGEVATITLDLASPLGAVTVLTADILTVGGDVFSFVEDELPVVPAGGVAELTLEYAPSTAGYHWAEVTLYTDEGEGNQHVVTVRGEADVAAGRIWPELIDFGPVQPETTAQQPITLVNEGRVPLSLSSIAFDNDTFFLAEAMPAEIAPGESLSLTLQASVADLSEQVGIGVTEGTLSLSLDVRANACSTASGDLYDSDGDGFGFCAGDCDDFTDTVSPGTAEVCDDLDNNCDGTIDEGTECYDDDGDGFSENDGDCADGDVEISPESVEDMANGIDDDCDGVVDDGTFDGDGDGYTTTGGDCDYTDDSIFPGAPELPDGKDNDCDGVIDEGTDTYDDDGDGYTEDDGDCDDSDASTYPGSIESADWQDNDCDGTVDEGTDNYDDDGDGYTETGGDCDDADASVSPGEVEVDGDGIDNDCSGEGT